jgi:hypothetical protein
MKRVAYRSMLSFTVSSRVSPVLSVTIASGASASMTKDRVDPHGDKAQIEFADRHAVLAQAQIIEIGGIQRRAEAVFGEDGELHGGELAQVRRRQLQPHPRLRLRAAIPTLKNRQSSGKPQRINGRRRFGRSGLFMDATCVRRTRRLFCLMRLERGAARRRREIHGEKI